MYQKTKSYQERPSSPSTKKENRNIEIKKNTPERKYKQIVSSRAFSVISMNMVLSFGMPYLVSPRWSSGYLSTGGSNYCLCLGESAQILSGENCRAASHKPFKNLLELMPAYMNSDGSRKEREKEKKSICCVKFVQWTQIVAISQYKGVPYIAVSSELQLPDQA